MIDIDATIALVSREEAKYFLESKGDLDDEMIDFFINAVSRFFHTVTWAEFIEDTKTGRYFDGSGYSLFVLPCFNLTVVSSITLDGSALTEGPDGDFCRYERDGILKLNSGKWTKDHQNILMTYTGGWTLAAIPADLKLAALRLIAIEYKHWQKTDWGETSRSLEGVSVSQFSEDSLDKITKEILMNYKKERF